MSDEYCSVCLQTPSDLKDEGVRLKLQQMLYLRKLLIIDAKLKHMVLLVSGIMVDVVLLYVIIGM